MHVDPPEHAPTPPDVRQFHLSTALGLMVLASAAFAVARRLGLDEYFAAYAQSFREHPLVSSFNLAIYVLLAWFVAGLFRRQIIQTVPYLPTNGAFCGTVYGGALFGMTVALFMLSNRSIPPAGVLSMVFCGITGAGWAAAPALVVRIIVGPFDTERLSPWRAAGVGALFGAMAGYGSLIFMVFWSPGAFLAYGLLPASFGAVCGARGAYLQALVRAERPLATRRQLERLRSTIYDAREWGAYDAPLERDARRDGATPD